MGNAYERARDLCREVGDSQQRVSALYGFWVFRHNRAELDAAHQVGQELLRFASTQNDVEAKLQASRIVGISLMFLGRFGSALKHLEQAVPAHRLERSIPPYGRADAWAVARSFIAWTLLLQGYSDRARSQRLQALAAARELGHPYTSAFIWHVNCLLCQVCGDRASAEECSAALMALATEQGFPHFLATGTLFHGWALAAKGSIEAGIDEMRRGLAAKEATGAEIKIPYYLGLLASAYVEAGQLSEALPLLAEAFDRLERTGERWFESELHRCKGEVLLSLPERDRAAAQAYFRRALAVGQEQGAKLWELRAATSLARLWREGGKRAEARDLLAPVYSWFTEGFDTQDLKDAKALLNQLT
jgi:predicted ATPase